MTKRNTFRLGLILTIVTLILIGGVSYPHLFPGEVHTIIAVGDIAKKGGTQAVTAELVATLHPEKVLVLGDTVYEDGTIEEYMELYEPTWGKFKSITAPTPGNHEYHTPGATGYYEYFGASAGPDKRGYYSYDLGSWHLISLNSEILDEAQMKWLRDDLEHSAQKCILAYWHKPLLSSGKEHGNSKKMKDFWDELYKNGADLVLNGHEHDYERFAKLNPDQVQDSKGIREFVVGTGGADQHGFDKIHPASQTHATHEYGVLLLTLNKNSYDAEFRPAEGSTFKDKVKDVACN